MPALSTLNTVQKPTISLTKKKGKKKKNPTHITPKSGKSYYSHKHYFGTTGAAQQRNVNKITLPDKFCVYW